MRWELISYRVRAPYARSLGFAKKAYHLAPAREAVAYEKVITNSTIDSMNKFKGFPRPELDEAWEDGYLRCRRGNAMSESSGSTNFIGPNIVVSEDDLKAVNRTSIKLTDGSGFLGTLGVFHQIHCLWVSLFARKFDLFVLNLHGIKRLYSEVHFQRLLSHLRDARTPMATCW